MYFFNYLIPFLKYVRLVGTYDASLGLYNGCLLIIFTRCISYFFFDKLYYKWWIIKDLYLWMLYSAIMSTNSDGYLYFRTYTQEKFIKSYEFK